MRLQRFFIRIYDGVTTTNARRVQKNMNYHPDNEFAAYDIKLYFLSYRSSYCDFASVVEWCKNVGIPTVPVFFHGNSSGMFTI